MTTPLESRSRGGKPRGLGQRVALVAALTFYGGAVLCLVLFGLRLGALGAEHPVIASLAAAVVFFVGGGIVLHVIGRVDLPDLRLRAGAERDDDA